jgi:hypothetical protein
VLTSRIWRALERLPADYGEAGAYSLGLVAAVAAAAVVVEPVESAPRSVVRAAARAWQSLLGERPEAASGQRMIVVLEAPSLADRIAAAEAEPASEDQKRWVGEAQAAQQLLLARLNARGIEIRRARSFFRTLNGCIRPRSRRRRSLGPSSGRARGAGPRRAFPASTGTASGSPSSTAASSSTTRT